MYLKSKNDKYIDISKKEFIIEKPIKYGRLYNWYAATDSRGIAPDGWHVPTKAEFEALLNYVDPIGSTYTNVAGGKLKQAGDEYWIAPNVGADNSTDFSAYGSGIYNWETNSFMLIGDYTTFLFSDVDTSYETPDSGFSLDSELATLAPDGGFLNNGLSIRLIKDNSINEGNVTIDGDVYNTVSIGTQVWLKQNLAVKHYNNGDLIGSDFNGTEGAVTAYNNDENNVYDTSTVVELFPIINGSILYDTILDNPIDADRFNDTNTLDVLDLEFPCEESLIQPIIDLCLKEIGVINNITRDTTNNASDDASLPKQQ